MNSATTLTASPTALQPDVKGIGLSRWELCLAFSVTVSLLALAAFLQGETGLKMLPVALGWPHIILGFVFYFGKVLRGDRQFHRYFFFLALLTLAIWFTHHTYNITRLIYIFFFYHAFKDEIFVNAVSRTRTTHPGSQRDLLVVVVSILLLLFMPQPRDLQRQLRSVDIAAQDLKPGWVLISFEPVRQARGLGFYFHLHAPQTAGLRSLATRASRNDFRPDGEILIGDEKWSQAADLIFQPYYEGEARTPPTEDLRMPTTAVLLTGGHRVGQTFIADRDNLAGIWLPVEHLEQEVGKEHFIAVLEGEPALPRALRVANLRLIAIFLLIGISVWRLGQNWSTSQRWALPLMIAVVCAGGQALLGKPIRLKDLDTHVFQVVVVFHYLLWYLFSLQKLKHRRSGSSNFRGSNLYDRFLTELGQPSSFTAAVIALNLLSLAGVLWYYLLNGPVVLRFAFDYSYFLYALVFHVTFSLQPKPSSRPL